MKSLAHSPDIVGLFFSVLNQFTSTSSFINNGQIITIKTETYELQGHNLIAKIFCGIANWFGHLMSDVAGSSGASGRGSGIVIPFFELFQFCDFGRFQVGENRNTLAAIAIKSFQEGYDARYGLAMAIPVLVCDLSVKLIWSIKHFFYHKRPLVECVPTKRHDDLRMMLLIGSGALCLMDGTDAALRSGGNYLAFFMRLNFVAWLRLVFLVLREIGIRLGISFPLQKQLDSYIRINEALTLYLDKLKQIDYERYRKECEQYDRMLLLLEKADTGERLNEVLKNEYAALGLKLPYSGNFNDFMQDKSKRLRFE